MAAQCYSALQQYLKSRDYYEKAFLIEKRYISSKDTLLLNTLDALYDVNIQLGEYSEAEKAIVLMILHMQMLCIVCCYWQCIKIIRMRPTKLCPNLLMH